MFVCLRTLSVEETYVCFSQVSQLEGRVKQLEQELLDTRDGAGDKLDLPVGKMQVCISKPFKLISVVKMGRSRFPTTRSMIP